MTLVTLWSALPASAHTELEGSDPQHTATVTGPVTRVRLAFTADADPVADEFSIRDANDTEIAIAAVVNRSPTAVVVKTEQPLPSGTNRVYWALRGADGHVLTGAIVFTVDPAASPAATTATDGRSAAAYSSSDSGAPTTGLAELLAHLARWLVYLSVLFCIGGLGYLAWVHRGSPAEGRRLVFYVRRAAVVTLVASVLAWGTELIVYDLGSITGLVSVDVWADLLSSNFALGTLCRLAGAGLVLCFLTIRLDEDFIDPFTPGPPPTRSPGGESSVAIEERVEPRTLSRLRVDASPVALVGGVLLVLSEAFLGHTASVDPRALVLASDAVHVTTAGLWATGAFMLAATIRSRRRRAEPLDARLLATRFSIVATWALVAVAITGAALAWAILGEVVGLWETAFGRLLVLKLLVVAGIAGIGAYNHRVMVPALIRGDEAADERFGVLVSVEAALFGIVLLVTALLVAASPT